MWNKISHIILRQRLLLIIILSVITAFFVANIPYNQVSYDLSRLLPVGDATATTFEDFKEKYGANDNVYLVSTEDSSLYELEKFQLFYDFSKEIQDFPVVDSVFSVANFSILKKDLGNKKFELSKVLPTKPIRQSQVDSTKALLENQPFYERILYLPGTNISVMAITLNSDSLTSTNRNRYVLAVAKHIDEFSEKTGVKFTYSGMPYIRAKLSSQVEDEIKLFIVLAISLTALLLWFFVRSPRAVLVSLLVVSVSVIWLLGTLGFLSRLSDLGYTGTMNFKVNVLTSLIPPLVIIIGIPNCIFLLNKYFAEYKEHKNQAKALTRVIEKIGGATFMTNATTASGFATFIFASSDILREFGIVASLSIMNVFILSLLLLPIIYSYISPPKEKHYQHLEYKWTNNLLDWFVNVCKNYRGTVYVVTIFIALLAGFGMSLMNNDALVVDDIPEDDPVMVDLRYYEETFNGVVPFEIIIKKTKGKLLTKKTFKKVEELYTYMASKEEFSKPISVIDFIKYTSQAFYNGDPDEYKMVYTPDAGSIRNYVKNSGGDSDEMMSAFLGPDQKEMRVSLQMKDVGTKETAKLMEELMPKINSIFNGKAEVDKRKYKIDFTGVGVIVTKGVDSLISNLIMSLILTVLIISTLMAFMFKNVRMVFISLLPNILPLFITAAVMGYFGVNLKPSTILVFSIAFGISVDDTIHFLAKYRQELSANNGEIKISVLNALRETGLSMFYTSIVLFFGFGIFIASDFGGTVALGLLVSLTLMVAMLSNLILLPCLLLTLDKLISVKTESTIVLNEKENN